MARKNFFLVVVFSGHFFLQRLCRKNIILFFFFGKFACSTLAIKLIGEGDSSAILSFSCTDTDWALPEGQPSNDPSLFYHRDCMLNVTFTTVF